MAAPLSLIGTYGSPYSLKMRAVLRYRHIPFTWVLQNTPGQFALPKPPVAIIPVLGFPDADGTVTEVMVDSTPQIARLEEMFTDRSLVPTDPAIAFLHLLIEDYADEWVTKQMYHYRWAPPEAVERARRLLPVWPMLHEDDARLAQWGDWIVDRQVGRRALVGSTDAKLCGFTASTTSSASASAVPSTARRPISRACLSRAGSVSIAPISLGAAMPDAIAPCTRA